MDVRFINPLLESLMNVLSTMVKVEPKPGKPELKKDEIACGEVTGFMVMESEKANGSMAITFTTPVIIDIVKRMLGADITEVDDMAKDLTGEMANMVVGGAKNLLNENGYDFKMSLPEVLAGEAHQIKHKYKGQTVILPFTIDAGSFFVEICFEQ